MASPDDGLLEFRSTRESHFDLFDDPALAERPCRNLVGVGVDQRSQLADQIAEVALRKFHHEH